ncbi:MAG: hypothetical protein GXP08_03020 [Gammaproteobacteria bacterium]|nr:hypothetical protein [Gammaproteobacteria bacterium]
MKTLLRMRWFFLSILVLYLWFTPGTTPSTSFVTIMPELNGLWDGLLRVFSLILIVMAVNYFVAPISKDKLIAAILWLLKPLRWIRIDGQKLAVRIALTFNLVSRAQYLFTEGQVMRTQHDNKRQKSTLGSRLNAIVDMAVQLFKTVISEAVCMESQTIDVNTLKAPSVLQWVAPVMMVAVFWGGVTLLGPS